MDKALNTLKEKSIVQGATTEMNSSQIIERSFTLKKKKTSVQKSPEKAKRQSSVPLLQDKEDEPSLLVGEQEEAASS